MFRRKWKCRCLLSRHKVCLCMCVMMMTVDEFYIRIQIYYLYVLKTKTDKKKYLIFNHKYVFFAIFQFVLILLDFLFESGKDTNLKCVFVEYIDSHSANFLVAFIFSRSTIKSYQRALRARCVFSFSMCMTIFRSVFFFLIRFYYTIYYYIIHNFHIFSLFIFFFY